MESSEKGSGLTSLTKKRKGSWRRLRGPHLPGYVESASLGKDEPRDVYVQGDMQATEQPGKSILVPRTEEPNHRMFARVAVLERGQTLKGDPQSSWRRRHQSLHILQVPKPGRL